MMTASNYIVQCNMFMIDAIQEEHSNSLAIMDSEYKMIIEALNKNYITLEADTSTTKKEGIFTRIINAIKSLFSKFVDKTKSLLVPLDSWIKNTLNLIDDINFDGLEITVLPYWKANDNDTISKINAMISYFTNTKDSDEVNRPTTTDEIVAQTPPFKEFYNKSIGFSQVCKTRFSFDKFVSEDKAETFGGVKLSNGDEIKKTCDIIRKYIIGYKEYTNKLTSLSNKFKSELEKAERDIKTAISRDAAKESMGLYLHLEEAFMGATELRFCRNYSALFEETKVETKDNSSPKTEVVNTDKNDDTDRPTSDTPNKTESMNFLKYKKNLATLIMNAIAAAITVAEAKLIVYKDVITKIVNSKKGTKKKPAEEK